MWLAVGMDLRVLEEGGHSGLTESGLEVTCGGSSLEMRVAFLWDLWVFVADLGQKAGAGSWRARACGGCEPPRPFQFGGSVSADALPTGLLFPPPP